MADVDGEGDGDGDGWVTPEDCDDARSDVHPGAADVPYDEVDQDCDGADLVDVDGDGWAGIAAGGEDCDDAVAEVHPEAEEVCGDLRDGNCDGEVDEACRSEVGPPEAGGFSWVCGTPADASGILALAAAAWVAWRSR